MNLKNKWKIASIVLVVVLIVSNGILFSKYNNTKFQLLYSHIAVPDIDLNNNMIFTENGIASGSISGFVVFFEQSSQPRSAKQYYIITASNNYNENYKQVFYYDEIIKLDSIPPKNIGREILTIENKDKDTISLIDKHGNIFKIWKTTRSFPQTGNYMAVENVRFFDVTGDSGYLITNQGDFRDFIVNGIIK